MANWPEYTSHKIVQAARIVWVSTEATPGAVRQIHVDPNEDGVVEPFECTVPAMANQAVVGGYAIKYADGYRSISPRGVFEAGYVLSKA